MQNELKIEPLRELNTFLEEEKGKDWWRVNSFCDDNGLDHENFNMWLQDHDTRLVNKVLEIVGKQATEKEAK